MDDIVYRLRNWAGEMAESGGMSADPTITDWDREYHGGCDPMVCDIALALWREARKAREEQKASRGNHQIGPLTPAMAREAADTIEALRKRLAAEGEGWVIRVAGEADDLLFAMLAQVGLGYVIRVTVGDTAYQGSYQGVEARRLGLGTDAGAIEMPLTDIDTIEVF